jgi:hypothetical protein
MVIVNRNPHYGKNAETAIKELQEGTTDSTAENYVRGFDSHQL